MLEKKNSRVGKNHASKWSPTFYLFYIKLPPSWPQFLRASAHSDIFKIQWDKTDLATSLLIILKENKTHMILAGWEVRIVKQLDRCLENAAWGHRPQAAFSRPGSQFFPIRTDPKPANNMFILGSFIYRDIWLVDGKYPDFSQIGQFVQS